MVEKTMCVYCSGRGKEPSGLSVGFSRLFAGAPDCFYCEGTGKRVPDDFSFSIPQRRVDVFVEPGTAPAASIGPGETITIVVKVTLS